jgi:hypothetical protein
MNAAAPRQKGQENKMTTFSATTEEKGPFEKQIHEDADLMSVQS